MNNVPNNKTIDYQLIKKKIQTKNRTLM